MDASFMVVSVFLEAFAGVATLVGAAVFFIDRALMRRERVLSAAIAARWPGARLRGVCLDDGLLGCRIAFADGSVAMCRARIDRRGAVTLDLAAEAPFRVSSARHEPTAGLAPEFLERWTRIRAWTLASHRSIERLAFETALAIGLFGVMGGPVALITGRTGLLLVCMAAGPIPWLYERLRENLDRRRLLRCDWLCVATRSDDVPVDRIG